VKPELNLIEDISETIGSIVLIQPRTKDRDGHGSGSDLSIRGKSDPVCMVWWK